MVPETQDAQSPVLEPRCALLVAIAVGWGVVLPAIEFDDEVVLVAIEVQDVGWERMLAAEFEAVELLATQGVPQLALLGRHLATQFTGASECGWV